MSNINTAKVSFNQDGIPYSDEFSDIYFAHDDDCSQSQHIFIRGNQIPQIWSEKNLSQDKFVIVETGFGTGMNFLLTLQHFIAYQAQCPTPLPLKFISTEKYPMSHADLKKALSIWPSLSEFSAQLLNQYDYSERVSQPMRFANGLVELQIYFCDSTEALSELQDESVDAFYLDGFAPINNPEMWQQPLFDQIGRIAKKNASLATFTVAGVVKRGLTNAGFHVQKHQLGGYKLHTLTAQYRGLRQSASLPGYQIRQYIDTPKHVTIVGGGLASACLAAHLVDKGIEVELLCKDSKLAQGASGNAIGAIYPLLHQQQDEISCFYQQAFDYALHYYAELTNQGYHFDHRFNGLIDLCYKPPLQARWQVFKQSNCWPDDLIHPIDQEQVNKQSGIDIDLPGLFYPRAGWISPPQLVNALIQKAKDTGLLRVKGKVKIDSITQTKENLWQIVSNKGTKQVQHLILCPGADSLNLEVMNTLPLTSVRGQVSVMQTNNHIQGLKTVLCHKGYLTPENQGTHCIGATFDKNSMDIESRHADDEYNLNMLEKCIGNPAKWDLDDVKDSRARLRCTTPDHMPIVGSMPDINAHKTVYAHLSKDKNWRVKDRTPSHKGLFVLTGLGARGLCSAPLLAKILTAELCNEHFDLDDKMLFNLAPNRFVIRDIIRRKFD
ncbi:bifunctional tRNA (5-methylaminomethyl-2-thiouridine)(34)-methyltransferase MnmD/FAD-dependent 5-carboxymethylaminomethyl-2-thiouridine(34) oxidoreductase MnmC [Thalassotalea aquiviva]|uniref:bifunctional tRNA (5-methylaminomethyl-2-thiouridine)(34)-methyltransferase MnmD/FAD-dependent 5-carboxymethylaminomethyl-2-thiouridine(34) oxidoreductase MnmC n=1 Tax=Thalassotalea aquiviva TaxID=3242415 RepID=UPI00352B71DB